MTRPTRVHKDGPTWYYNMDMLTEYTSCPMRYKLKYIDKIDEKESPKDRAVTQRLKAIKFKHQAEKVVTEFAKQLESGTVMDRRDFRNWLGRQWYSKMTKHDFLVNPLEKGERLSTASIVFMDRVYDELAGVSGIIVAVNMPYKVIISQDCPALPGVDRSKNLGIYGVIPMLARTRRKTYTIIIFANDTYPAWSTPIQAIAVDYRAQAISFAFRSMYRILETNLHIIDFARLATYDVQCDRRHYIRLKTMVEHAAFSEAYGYPPMPSDRCSACGYKAICMI